MVSKISALKSNYSVQLMIPNMWKESLLLRSILIMLVAFLPSKLTEQKYILHNTTFPEKVRFPEVTY